MTLTQLKRDAGRVPLRWRRCEALTGIIYVALVAVSLIPVCSVRYPESVDYFNHLGGLFVLTAPSDHPVHAFYRPDWHLVPNLGLELLVLGLNRLMPLESAMKAAFIIIFIALPGAFFFLYTSIHRKIRPGLLLSALCLFNLPLTAGFLSFSLGLAAALATTGVWIRLGEKTTVRNLLILNALSAAILIMHAAALAALGLTIVAMHALRPPWRTPALISRAVAAGCGFLAPLLLLILMRDSSSAHQFPQHILFTIAQKPLLLFAAVFTASPAANAIGACALVASLYILFRHARARFEARLVPALIAWAIVLIALPHEIDRATVIDRRLVLFPALLFLAGLCAPPNRLQWIAGAVAAAAVCVRAVILLPAWQDYNFAIADLRSLERAVEPGAKILIASAPEKRGSCNEPYRWPPLYHHPPVLFLMERHAFTALFSTPGLQPIRATENYRAISDPGAPVLEWDYLAAADTEEGRKRILEELGSSPWRPFFGWRDSYDYLLVLSLNCAGEIQHDNRLEFLAGSKAYLLYKIVHSQ